MTVFKIIGSSHDPNVYYCKHLAERIINERPEYSNVTLDFAIYLEIEYLPQLEKLKTICGGGSYGHKALHIVTRDGVYIGDIKAFIEIAKYEYGIEDADIANDIAFNRYSREETLNLLLANGRKAVFLDFAADTKKKKGTKDQTDDDIPKYGKVVIELFTEICPMACENFQKLCTGEAGVSETGIQLNYIGSPIHRIVQGGWIQGGDIVDGTGVNSIAAIGTNNKVRDESFSVDFGCPSGGIVGFSTSAPHSNGSQFFITLGPADWMNGKFVGIGRVIQGFDVLKKIEAAPCVNQKPSQMIYVENCGNYVIIPN